MAIRPDGQDWTIKEQIIEDPVTGLTFQFERLPSGRMMLHLFGKSLQFGNRHFVFAEDGTEAGSGVYVAGLCKPGWLTEIEE